MYSNLFPKSSSDQPRATSLRQSALRFAGLGLAFSLSVFAPALSHAAANAESKNAPRKSAKVLHVGNSFSNNAATYLPQLAKAGGKDLLLAGATIGGCSFERHARHMNEFKEGKAQGSAYTSVRNFGFPSGKKKFSLPEALEAQQWDFVTIQQASPYSFRPESYEPYAGQVIAEIREKAPQATILIHQTWPYRPDHSLLKKENMTPDDMYTRLVDAYTQLGNRYGFGFLPSGNAVYTASKTDEWSFAIDPSYDYKNPTPGVNPKEKGLYPGGRWIKRQGKDSFSNDAFHLNAAGCYLIGSVWYEILFNDSVLNVDFVPEGLTAEQAAHLRKIAHETVAAYRTKGAL